MNHQEYPDVDWLFIKQRLLERAANGHIDCAGARALAEELQVSYRSIGQAANELKIKIAHCELGCF
ncbi:hypothetical protein [Heliophilum fasciatum]|uniref:Uncharacterized protein n=1 Tax=Heliophilum fasciatum TaxID=35700 RepID=A0A4V2SY74_9FIRM|nr:hypothetical protein [Heliophilum fasciatum]MCW2276631.1 hypothetical protein [Heliophilum fasciatum]TCP68986.1 hypothetical protein EDD73_101154 [Heliophilum fasciatum]